MTERMKLYRKNMEAKGLVQIRVWIEKEDEEFIKFIAKFCRKERLEEKKRYGRPANPFQIRIAKSLSGAKNIPEPKHLYDYHISLAGWIWRYK